MDDVAQGFVHLSELGYTVAEIAAHYRLSPADLVTLAKEEFGETAEDANHRLRAAGPMGLLITAARQASMGHEKLLIYLLDKLWKPRASTSEETPASKLTTAQLEKIHRIMSDSQ